MDSNKDKKVEKAAADKRREKKRVANEKAENGQAFEAKCQADELAKADARREKKTVANLKAAEGEKKTVGSSNKQLNAEEKKAVDDAKKAAAETLN